MVSIADVWAARHALMGRVRPTPIVQSEALDALTGSRLYAKAECLQLTGSFKVRGALYRMGQLSEAERGRGVVAASAGNHALAVAYAARQLGVQATVCMPEQAVAFKVEGVRALGARVLQPGRDSSALFTKVEELQREQGMVPIPPFDAAAVVAGAGTVTLEFLEAVSDLDYLIIPCSGGGLLAGALVAARALAPRTRVIGVQPESCPGIIESLAAGEPVTAGVPDTIADGLTARRPGAVNMAIIESLVDEVVALPDPPIRRAMGLIARQLKLVVEGAGAIGLALVLCDGRFAGKRTGLVLSGGNVSPSLAAEVMVAE